MSTQEILDSIYIIPILIDHIDNPKEETRKILNSKGIFEWDVDELKKIKHLLEYHHGIIMDDFKVDRISYKLLRSGLAQYFDCYLAPYFENLESDKKLKVLDYGAGDGQVAKLLRERNPDWTVYALDRDKGDIKLDFEQSPDWYQIYLKEFELVILSEVLHCKQPSIQQYLIHSSYKILKPGGRLIVVENIDHIMAYRIGKIKGEPHCVLDEFHIRELTEGVFELDNIQLINNHKFYELKKLSDL